MKSSTTGLMKLALKTILGRKPSKRPSVRKAAKRLTNRLTTKTTPSSEEVRVVDPTTGGEKGAKLARFSLIPPEFSWALAEHFGKGAFKYEDRNWEKGYDWSLSVDAMERHITQWKLGETRDQETGSHHLICAAWHACALFCYDTYDKGTDNMHNRPLTSDSE